MTRFFLLACVVLVWAVPQARTSSVPRIPIEDFFEYPVVSGARISPDGAHVVFRSPMEGRVGLVIMDVATGKCEPLASLTDENIVGGEWKNNRVVLIYADSGGNEAFAVKSIDIKTRSVRQLFNSVGWNTFTRVNDGYGGIEDMFPADDDEVIASTTSSSSGEFGIYRMNVVSRRTKEVGGLGGVDGAVRRYFFDTRGDARVRLRVYRGMEYFEVRKAGSETYEKLGETSSDGVIAHLEPVALLADDTRLVVYNPFRGDHGTYVIYDIEAGAWRENVYALEVPDGEPILSPKRERVLGFHFSDDRPRVRWLDPELAGLQESLEKGFPGMTVTFQSFSDDLRRIVVVVVSDREPGGTFILDRTGPKPRLQPIGPSFPKLKSEWLQPMRPVRYHARDGLEIPAYLTLPAGAEGRRVPLIVNPHGGPFGVRDEWGYNPEVQWLVNRGYAVLQPNYRGSGGYGRSFVNAGKGEWGGKMQDDITDGVRWAISSGVADPKRIAIYGASYGGYAALVGVTQTPDLYACAINYLGIADLTIAFDRDIFPNSGVSRDYVDVWIGGSTSALRARSPLYAIDKIRVPTLHAYGKNDVRVEYTQWKRLKSALDDHGKAYEYHVEEDAGHGFQRLESRVRFYRAMEAFLERHLPVD